VDEAAWGTWRAARAGLRQQALPAPEFVVVEGAGSADTAVMRNALDKYIGKPVDISALELTLTELGGLGRYETLIWQLRERDRQTGLVVRALPKPYAPPFLFLAVTLENTSADTFRFSLSGRYLTYDLVGSGSELRVDATVGSDPSAGAALYRPLGSSRFFVEPGAGVASQSLNVIGGDRIIASYREVVTSAGADVGVNLGQFNELRTGYTWSHVNAQVEVGDPGLPDFSGNESDIHATWTHDSQDNAIFATRGVHAQVELQHFLTAPDLRLDRSTAGVTQAMGAGSWVRRLDPAARNRIFVNAGAGTSFGDHPLPTNQFTLGGPFQLSALEVDERRGDNFVLLSGGYFRQVGRLPDFFGGPVLLGGWVENGSAFDRWSTATFDTNFSVGLLAETLVGPVFIGGSVGLDRSSRFYVGIGRIFR
jgi:NTE family protein